MKRSTATSDVGRHGAKQARLDSNEQGQEAPKKDDGSKRSLENQSEEQLALSRRGVRRTSSGSGRNDSSKSLTKPSLLDSSFVHQNHETSKQVYTALKTRRALSVTDKTPAVSQTPTMKHQSQVHASLLQKISSPSSKSLKKVSALPQTSSKAGIKSPIPSKPNSVTISGASSHVVNSTVTSNSSLNVLNHAQTVFSVSSLKETASDVLPSSLIPPFRSFDAMYVGSSIPSPLFNDSTISFPLLTPDYIMDPDCVNLDQLLNRLPSESSGFTSIRSSEQSARSDGLQNQAFSSPRLLDSTRVRSPHVYRPEPSNSQRHAASVDNIHTHGIASGSRVKSSERFPSHGSSMTATVSRELLNKTSGLSGYSHDALMMNGGKSRTSQCTTDSVKSIIPTSIINRLDSFSSFMDIKPPPPGGIKRAGPYLLGKQIS